MPRTCTCRRSSERVDVARRAAGARSPRPARARARAPGAARASTPPYVDRAADAESGTRSAAANQPSSKRDSRRARRSASTSRKSGPTKCGSMKRSCSAVPQRHQRCRGRAAARTARSARAAAAAARGSCARAAASRRRGTRPGRGGRSGCPGEYSLSMQNSARCVLPVTSTSRLRNRRSTSQGGDVALVGLPGICCERDLQLVEAVVARLVDARRLAGRADEQAGEQVRQRRDGSASR